MLALPQQVMARPGLIDRISDIAADRDALTPPGPSRDDVSHGLAINAVQDRRPRPVSVVSHSIGRDLVA